GFFSNGAADATCGAFAGGGKSWANGLTGGGGTGAAKGGFGGGGSFNAGTLLAAIAGAETGDGFLTITLLRLLGLVPNLP
ncbi:hypothetical protein ABTN30_20530, partial [Acinetobacter baumannii]